MWTVCLCSVKPPGISLHSLYLFVFYKQAICCTLSFNNPAFFFKKKKVLACAGTHHVDHADLELAKICLPFTSGVLGLKTCTRPGCISPLIMVVTSVFKPGLILLPVS